jgi:hypothetical protein
MTPHPNRRLTHPPACEAGAEGEEMSKPDDPSEGSVDGGEAHVDFDAPAVLRKWPSYQGERRTDSTGPYLIVDATLDQCIREFMAKPALARHLYEIHTAPQLSLVPAVLSGEIVTELARLWNLIKAV